MRYDQASLFSEKSTENPKIGKIRRKGCGNEASRAALLNNLASRSKQDFIAMHLGKFGSMVKARDPVFPKWQVLLIIFASLSVKKKKLAASTRPQLASRILTPSELTNMNRICWGNIRRNGKISATTSSEEGSPSHAASIFRLSTLQMLILKKIDLWCFLWTYISLKMWRIKVLWHLSASV